MSPQDIVALRKADLRNAREFGTKQDVATAKASLAAAVARYRTQVEG